MKWLLIHFTWISVNLGYERFFCIYNSDGWLTTKAEDLLRLEGFEYRIKRLSFEEAV